MQILKSLDHLATHAGILAISAALDKPGSPLTYAGAEKWHRILAASTALMEHTRDETLRVVLAVL